VIDFASQPLSLLTGAALDRLDAAIRNDVMWRALDFVQVLANCALISIVVVGFGQWFCRGRHDKPPRSEPKVS
jgi:hypothetical protein